ncbi:Oidioi.mRNA.OKI2018_I69.chr1.g2861.t1.cds [Oikopleura dioica]|uniref:Oidioi.mRNA.OKI2018_I69.chr1.g2861.t1.cds n=1 Tax=Oikopleura dioica TaxID=34765 RepID=A0ABN7SSD6_OIKDI|nr:Oidioi.mRNA.OKI2018_I69.chr1.g2861.t1.cds [Oikopleura dioica]
MASITSPEYISTQTTMVSGGGASKTDNQQTEDENLPPPPIPPPVAESTPTKFTTTPEMKTVTPSSKIVNCKRNLTQAIFGKSERSQSPKSSPPHSWNNASKHWSQSSLHERELFTTTTTTKTTTTTATSKTTPTEEATKVHNKLPAPPSQQFNWQQQDFWQQQQQQQQYYYWNGSIADHQSLDYNPFNHGNYHNHHHQSSRYDQSQYQQRDQHDQSQQRFYSSRPMFSSFGREAECGQSNFGANLYRPIYQQSHIDYSSFYSNDATPLSTTSYYPTPPPTTATAPPPPQPPPTTNTTNHYNKHYQHGGNNQQQQQQNVKQNNGLQSTFPNYYGGDDGQLSQKEHFQHYEQIDKGPACSLFSAATAHVGEGSGGGGGSETTTDNQFDTTTNFLPTAIIQPTNIQQLHPSKQHQFGTTNATNNQQQFIVSTANSTISNSESTSENHQPRPISTPIIFTDIDTGEIICNDSIESILEL